MLRRGLLLAATAALAAAGPGTPLFAERFDQSYNPAQWSVLAGSPALKNISGQTPFTAMRLNEMGIGDLAVMESTQLFPCGTGLVINFAFNFWDNSGGNGDGFTFYMRKGSSSASDIGAGGGAMGYAPNSGNGMSDAVVGACRAPRPCARRVGARVRVRVRVPLQGQGGRACGGQALVWLVPARARACARVAAGDSNRPVCWRCCCCYWLRASSVIAPLALTLTACPHP
jgi:hypothetical protein